MTTRVLHMELTSRLSADRNMLELRRFIGRRGCPPSILSDNAKQFQLVNSVVEQQWQLLTFDEKLHDFVSYVAMLPNAKNYPESGTNGYCPRRGNAKILLKTAIIMEMISERTALIKMCPGGHISRRAVQHLYPLEIESDLGPNQKAITLDKAENNKSGKEVVNQPTTMDAPRRIKRKPIYFYRRQ